MRAILTTASWLGLLLTLVPPVLMSRGELDAPAMKTLMLAGSIVWFGARLLGSRSRPPVPPA